MQKKMLIEHLDAVFYGEAWHGAALLPTLQQIGFAKALEENAEGFSPWKVVLHCAYWKFYVRKALAFDGDRLSFARSPEDFPDLPDERTSAAWQRDVRFLEEEHRLLRTSVEDFPEDRLAHRSPEEGVTYAGLVLGAASHDVYHTAHIRNLGVQSFL